MPDPVSAGAARPVLLQTDVLVIGATVGGCAAAIAAARAGAAVVLLEPTQSIGGVSANGVHCFDVGSRQALGGITEEFTRRVLRHYEAIGLDDPMLRSRSDVFWEFHVADRIWREMLAEYGAITFINGAVPVGVTAAHGRIEAVSWEVAADSIGNPSDEEAAVANQVHAKIVIDATYEGDVAAWAGAAFHLGREARSASEPHAGVIYTATHERHVDAQGYLPNTILPGSSGEGDDRIMAFTSRLSLRFDPANDVARHLARPDSYDPSKYAWNCPAISAAGVPEFSFDLIPTVNGKMLLNQRDRGNDTLDGVRDYILAPPRERTAIRKRLFDHIVGFLYFIQNEGGMPELVLAGDEHVGNDHLPYLLYVREGRRFSGRATLTEWNINPFLAGDGYRPPLQPHSIAIGDWAIECRPCRETPHPETHAFDGAMVGRALRAPYQVPFGCLIPNGFENLLVTTTISASHVAFCALRIEAVWAQTGTAAGFAAGLAIRAGCPVADVSIAHVQDRLLTAGCKLTFFADLASDHPDFVAIQWLALRGFVPKDSRHRFFPGAAVTWSDLVEATVRAFAIPISVTGMHFEGLGPENAAFRYAETLYDAASRAGLPLFRNMRHPIIDAPADYLRAEPRTRWIDLPMDQIVEVAEAVSFVSCVRDALGLDESGDMSAATRANLTRGAMATVLHQAARAVETVQ